MKPHGMFDTRHLARALAVASFLALSSAAAGAKPLARADDTFRIIAMDDRFVAPKRIPAGLRHIVFENRGKETHEAMLVRLPDGMDADGYVAAVKAGALFPPGARDYSGPALTVPGETTEIWAQVDPGNSILICWNENHASTRRVHAFVATERGARDDAPPPEDLVLRLVDYRFELSQAPRKGRQVVRVDTAGPSMHEVDLYKLLDGKSVDDLVEWRRNDGKGAAPALALGGVLDSHDITRRTWMRWNLAPGRYVLHCEMPLDENAQSNTHFATHADAGMVSAFDIAD